MLEWMAHHQRLGVGRFYIFDNGSDPPLNATVAEHIASGLIKCDAPVNVGIRWELLSAIERSGRCGQCAAP